MVGNNPIVSLRAMQTTSRVLESYQTQRETILERSLKHAKPCATFAKHPLAASNVSTWQNQRRAEFEPIRVKRGRKRARCWKNISSTAWRCLNEIPSSMDTKRTSESRRVVEKEMVEARRREKETIR